MSSAAPSPEPGRPVDVCVDLPRLELDRPFTYLLPPDDDAGTGCLVSVGFHGRTVHGWILGESEDVPARVLPVRRVLSRVPVFRPRDLELYRWMAERYCVPLATAIGRAHPPRVAGEEAAASPPGAAPARRPARLPGPYQGGDALLSAARGGAGAFVVRPLPDHEAGLCLAAVAACIDGGRDAVVVVPEAQPLPETARAVAEAFGEAALLLVGGDERARYRAWLDVLAGRYRVVVGTRPAVFAPVPNLGLVWVHREGHPGHREERAPRHHVRDVALARARLEGAVAVVASLAPSAEAVALAEGGASVVRAPRQAERAAAPLVETIRPEGREVSSRLAHRLDPAQGAFLLVSRSGYGVARVCRDCGAPARCATCGGAIVVRRGAPACAVCAAAGACDSCGGSRFGIERRGTERVEEWAREALHAEVRRVDAAEDATPPAPGSVVVGTAAAVKDFGPLRIGTVAVLDADRALGRPGIEAAGQVLATWMEAASWAGPKGAGGRVVVQTEEPASPAVQALVRWDPWHLARHETAKRAAAGFPPGHPVVRVRGGEGLERALEEIGPVHALTARLGEETVSLVTLRPDAVSGFRAWALRRIADGTVTRVEAEPQL